MDESEEPSSRGEEVSENIFVKHARLYSSKIENIVQKIEDQKAFELLTKFEILEWSEALADYETKWDQAIMEIIWIEDMPRLQEAYFESQIARIKDRCINMKEKTTKYWNSSKHKCKVQNKRQVKCKKLCSRK